MQALIVDDDIAMVEVIRDSVKWKELGIDRLHIAFNISQAKRILEEYPVDIVVSDIEMPQGSGIQLLEWYRKQNQNGEFLFLTCHESFDYATNAVKLKAAEYLLKPFDVQIMEAALKKIILELKEHRRILEESTYGKWVKNNPRKQRNIFLTDLLSAQISRSREEVLEEIESRRVDIDGENKYRMVVSKLNNRDWDSDRINPNLTRFILENIHSEILSGIPDGAIVSCFEDQEYYAIATICSAENEYRDECEKLVASMKNLFHAEMTCCVSNPCYLWEFYEKYQTLLRIIDENVSFYGTGFQEKDYVKVEKAQAAVLKLDTLEEFLVGKRKLDFLSYLKQCLSERTREKSLDQQVLKIMQREILQSVYTYLGKKDISVAGLEADENLMAMEEKATRSVTDLLRFTNFLLEQMYSYEDSIKKQYQLSEKINQFIKEHYSEPIGRNEIAAYLYLAPEYVSKMYKKQTGISLNDAIAGYRIEQAKICLERGERVGDVAAAVGFENFTYFSTTFKKFTGLTPNQYRKQ